MVWLAAVFRFAAVSLPLSMVLRHGRPCQGDGIRFQADLVQPHRGHIIGSRHVIL